MQHFVAEITAILESIVEPMLSQRSEQVATTATTYFIACLTQITSPSLFQGEVLFPLDTCFCLCLLLKVLIFPFSAFRLSTRICILSVGSATAYHFDPPLRRHVRRGWPCFCHCFLSFWSAVQHGTSRPRKRSKTVFLVRAPSFERLYGANSSFDYVYECVMASS